MAGAVALGGLGALRAWERPLAPIDKAEPAFIGIGNYGAQNLAKLAGENIVAVCDVDWRDKEQLPGRFTRASEIAAQYSSAKRFHDWRVMLDRVEKQIDAVVFCTSDCVHAQAPLTPQGLGVACPDLTAG